MILFTRIFLIHLLLPLPIFLVFAAHHDFPDQLSVPALVGLRLERALAPLLFFDLLHGLLPLLSLLLAQFERLGNCEVLCLRGEHRAVGVGDVQFLAVDGELVVETEDFGLAQLEVLLFLFLEFLKLQVPRQTSHYHYLIFGSSRFLVKNVGLEGAVLLLLVVALFPSLGDLLLLFLQLLLQILRKLLFALAVVEGVAGLHLLILLVLGGFRAEGTVVDFQVHVLLLQRLLFLLALGVVRQLIQCRALSQSLADFVDLRLESVLLVNFLLDELADYFLPLGVLSGETVDAVEASLGAAGGVGLHDDVRGYVYLRLKRALSFLRVLLPLFFQFFCLSSHKSLLSFVKFLQIPIEKLRFLSQVVGGLAYLWLEGVLLVQLLMIALSMIHLLLYASLGLRVQPVYHVVPVVVALEVLDLGDVGGLVVDDGLEGQVALLLLLLHAQFLQFLIFLFLEDAHSLMDGRYSVELIDVDDGARGSHEFWLETAVFHVL